MVKCEICGEKVQKTFLNKILGTYMKDSHGKQRVICQNCQKEYDDEKLKEKLN